MRPKVILFDWDNTLVDTSHFVFQALNHTFEQFGRPAWTEVEARKHSQRSGREGFPVLFGDQWQKAQEIFYTYYDTYAVQNLRSLPGAESLLNTIQELGIQAGVVSNKRGPALRREIEYLGWHSYFTAQVGAGDALKDKPAPDPIFLALEQMGYPSNDQVWFVGDAPVDWQAAIAAGCWPVPLGFDHEEAKSYSQAVANCHELEKILLRI